MTHQDRPVVRPHNLTLTDEAWEHLVESHGHRGAAAALENAYRTANGLPPRPDVQQRGRFKPRPAAKPDRP